MIHADASIGQNPKGSLQRLGRKVASATAHAVSSFQNRGALLCLPGGTLNNKKVQERRAHQSSIVEMSR